jgi:type III pantothenate kinase
MGARYHLLPLTSHLLPLRMLLALDVGNTEITTGLFRGDVLTRHWRLTTNPDRTPDEWSAALGSFLVLAGHSPNEVRAAILASVAPGVTQSLVQGVKEATGIAPLVIDAGTVLPITLDVDEPHSVGADRILNTLAAVELYRGNTLVVDFGTATTFDCITADARFLGGVIMPGLRTSADQLTRRASKLPATELRPPERVIGRRTEECIRAGVLFGAADAVDGIVRRIKAEWPDGGKPKVIATGGLADTVAPLTTTIELVDPDLTLHGLRLAARHLGLSW